MRLDLYTGERERFLNYDCFCFTATNSTSTPKVLEYMNCCPLVIDAAISIPGNDSVKIFGETNFNNPPPGITITINEGATTCNECFQYKYKLVNCIDATVIYTNYLECPDCINYINLMAHTYLEPNPCWYVTVVPETPGPVTQVIINNEAYCNFCEGKCYTITGIGVITYFDGYGELTTANAPAIICSSSYPSVTGIDYEIVTNGLFCDNRNPCAYYYRLTNCETQVTILSNEPDLAFPYALDETVKLAEYPGACWTIEQFPIVN